MQDDKRIPSRLPVPSRAGRDLDAYAGGGSAAVGPGEAPAMNVLGAIWRRKGVVVACVVLAVAAGAVYLMRAAPLFSSGSVVYVQQSAPSSVFAPNELQTAINSAGYLYTQCQLITSTLILSKAVDQPGVADAKVLQGMQNPVGYLHAAVQAVPAKQGDLIFVTMDSPNAADAATIVNGVVAAYIEYQGNQHQSNSKEILRILREGYASNTAALKAAQERMLQLRRENPDLSTDSDKQGLNVQRLNTLSTEQTEAVNRAEDLKTSLIMANGTDLKDVGTLVGLVNQMRLGDQMPPSSVPQASNVFQQLKMRQQDLLDAGLGVGNDQVRRIGIAVDRAGADLADAQRQTALSCLATLKTASTSADKRVVQLQSEIDKVRAVGQKLGDKEQDYDNQAGLVTRYLHALDTLDEQIRKTESIVDVPLVTINVLETARPNLDPVSPKKSRVLGMATAAGLMAGLAAALLFDKVDQRLRSIEEISTLLDATILGVVPRIVRRILPGEAGREIQLRPRSGVAEAFRTVRTAIYFGGEERAVKTILITSPTPGDGKSTCISNLAIAVAQAGRRVLLIDADCRRPVQHKTFSIPDGPGLTGVLTGKATLADAVHPTEIDRLDLLQCGPLPHNPAELLDSQALLDLLGEAGRKYDQVLIDSPPVTLVSDARVLAASCDASVLVLRSERSTRRGATLAWNALASVGANLLGVIVNDIARQKDGYGYTYYGYGRYGYAPSAPELNGNGAAANGNGNGASVPVVTSPAE